MTDFTEMLNGFKQPAKASFIVGGQYGSEGKGAASAWVALQLAKFGQSFDIVASNSGAQSGHTSINKGKKRVYYHLPTYPFIAREELGDFKGLVYLNAGAAINPEGLKEELKDFEGKFYIHPMASVITDECRAAELDPTSSHTKVAGTRKGVGQSIARKAARSGLIARDHPYLKQFVRRIDLNAHMMNGKSVLIEIPQGVSLSLNHSPFYPYCTSRDCIPSSAMGDAGIHPHFYGQTMIVLRTFPIRVGNIVEGGETIGTSGGVYPDQDELSWEDLGVEAEVTTVTKRVRRVFTFSIQQLMQTFALCRPNVVYLSFCDYVKDQNYLNKIVDGINTAAKANWLEPPYIVYQWGATTEDAGDVYKISD